MKIIFVSFYMYVIYIVLCMFKLILLFLNMYICMIFFLMFLIVIILNNFFGILICFFKIDILMWKNKFVVIWVLEMWDCWDFGFGLNLMFLGNFIWCVYSVFYLIDFVVLFLFFFICFIKICNKVILNWN